MTWNWRGNKTIANSDSNVIAKSVLGTGSRESTAAVFGRSRACANSESGPSNIQNVTNTPTPTKATSLTIDSVAIASINPSWCSVASIWRVPKRTAKIAIATAT